MNCRNFLQFEIIKPERMVGMSPENPAVAPAEAEKPKPETPGTKTPPDKTPEQKAEEAKKANQEGDSEQEDARRLAELIVSPPSQAEMDNVSKKIMNKMTKFEEEFKRDFKPEDILTPAFTEKILNKTRELLAFLTDHEKGVMEYIISVQPTEDEKTHFRTKYTKEGNLSFKLDEKASIRDLVIFLYLATEEGPDKVQLLKGMNPETGANFTKLGVLLKNSHRKLLEQRKADEAKQIDLKKLEDEATTALAKNKKYEEASVKYSEGKIDKNTFLQIIVDPTDRATVQRWLDAEETAKEAVPEEKKEDGDKTSDALKGVGLGALLERLIDKLTKLFDKLSVELEKAFGSFEKKTASIKSPLGGDKKITIKHEYEKGKGLTIEADAGNEIHSVTSGTVTNVDKDKGTVEITKDDKSKTIYTNVEPNPDLKTEDPATKIEPGKQMVIGKAASGDGIGFRYIDKNNVEQDPRTELFEKAGLVEKKPETAPAAPTAGTPQAPTAPPAVPATGAPATTPK